MTNILPFLFGLALLLLPSVHARAVEAFTPAKAMDGIFIGRHLDHYADATKELTLADIRREPYERQFAPVNRDTLDFGMSSSAHWIRLTVNNPSADHIHWILQAEHPLLNHIEVYEISRSGETKFHEGGTQIPFNRRDIACRKSAFTMKSPPGTSEVYIKVWSDWQRIVANCTFTAWGPNGFIAKNNADTLVLGLYYGALLAMCLYNLFIYFSVRDATYLYYVSYIVFAALTYFVANGLVFQYLWIASPLAGLGYAMCSFVCAILFSRSFLNTRKTMPTIDKILLTLAAIYAVNGFMMFAMPATVAVAVTAGYFSGLAVSPLLLYAGARSLKAGSRPARYYIIAWTVYLAGVTLYFLKDLGVIPYSFAAAYSMQIGTLADVILLSLALAERIKVLREEKEAAQSLVIEQEQRALKTAEEARVLLEKEIVKRTALLKESESRFRQFSDATFEGIVIHDGGIIIDLNEMAAGMMGYTPAELTGQNGLDLLIAPECRMAMEAYINNKAKHAYEATGIKKDGSLIFLELRGRAVTHQGREVLITAVRDISERKKAEEDLREALSRLQKIASRVPGIVYQFRMRPDGGFSIPYASEAARDIYRIDPEEVREDAAAVFAHVHPDDLEAHIASIKASARDLTPWVHEYRLKFGSEPEIWIMGNAAPEREADGSVLWHGFITDITKRKNMEEALRSSEELWKFAVDGSRAGIFDWNITTDSAECTDRWKEIFGIDGRNFAECASRTHPDDLPGLMADLQKHFEGKTPTSEYEFRIMDNAGGWKWTLGSGVVVSRDTDGKPLRFVGTITDITGRKKTEEALRRSEERWKFALEGSRDGIFDWHVPSGVGICSERWKEIFGVDGSSFDQFQSRIHPDDLPGVMANLRAHFEGKTPYSEYEFRIMDGKGGWKWNLGRGMAVSRDDSGRPVRIVGTNTDITGRKQAELELRQAKEQAENATRLKDKFVSLVTHDLKGPLGSLAVGLETLHRNGDLVPADQLFVGKMARHSRELLGLTERLLDLTQLQAGKIVPRKRFINCRNFAAAQIGLFQNAAAQKEITIVNSLPAIMKVYADPDFSGECVKNLLSNAIKFCGKGDTITVFNPPNMPSTIAVQDDGPGIAPKKIASLFVAAMKERSLGSAGEKGAGIGLAHTKELMEAGGGGVAVESDPGKGSTFYLIFPHTLNITVLVVDDQEIVRGAIREHCAGIFPSILEAGNGAEALAVVKTVTPHLIITDINMPVMDGLEFIRQVRGDGMARHVPIIAMTSDETRLAPNGMDIRSYCLHIGADDFVNKPVTANDLVPRVSRLLQETRV